MNFRPFVLAAVLSFLGASALAAERGYYGLSLAVDADGMFLNPTLRQLKVRMVEPDSPAARAGLSAGDTIVEVEGLPVAGSKAEALRPYLQPEPGRAARILVVKQDGRRVPVVLTAISRQPH